MRACLYIAWAGLILSIVVHIATFTGHNDFLNDWEPFVFFLHGGVVFLGLPVVVVSQKIMKDKDEKKFWKIVLENCPRWMKTCIRLCVIYGFLSFIVGWFIKSSPVTGAPFKEFSSMWIVFYSIESGAFYSHLHKPTEKEQ